ncbi:MAG: zinc ABC transporter substrate-binding protein [Chlamydiota bacterium]
MRFRFICFLLITLTICTLSCTRKPSSQSNLSKPLVIVSLSPYDTFVKDIAGDTLTVKVAVPPNYNAHVFEPTPKHLANFHQASLWFGIGEPFEAILLRTLTQRSPKLVTIDLSKNIPLRHDASTCSAAHSHSLHSALASDETIDRHFWMSPHIAWLQVEIIAETLIHKFPENKGLYEKNLEIFRQKLLNLDKDLHHLLNPYKGQAIIISHPSLGYFCQDYDLLQISIECEGKTPLPADLYKVIALAKEHKALCVFTQEQFDNKGALLMAKQLHLPAYSINPNLPEYFDNLMTIAKNITGSQ